MSQYFFDSAFDSVQAFQLADGGIGVERKPETALGLLVLWSAAFFSQHVLP